MVGTRHAANYGSDDEDELPLDTQALHNKAIARTLNKLRIDGTDFLKGERSIKRDENDDGPMLETYKYRGAVYAKDSTTKPEWISEPSKRGRKRSHAAMEASPRPEPSSEPPVRRRKRVSLVTPDEEEAVRPRKRRRRTFAAVGSSPARRSTSTVPKRRRSSSAVTARQRAASAVALRRRASAMVTTRQARAKEAKETTPQQISDTTRSRPAQDAPDWRPGRAHVANGGRDLIENIQRRRDSARDKGYQTSMLAEDELHPQLNPRRVPTYPPVRTEQSEIDVEALRNDYPEAYTIAMQAAVLAKINTRIQELRKRLPSRAQRQRERLQRFREQMRLANAGLIVEEASVADGSTRQVIQPAIRSADELKDISSDNVDQSVLILPVPRTSTTASDSPSLGADLSSSVSTRPTKRHDSAAGGTPPTPHLAPSPSQASPAQTMASSTAASTVERDRSGLGPTAAHTPALSRASPRLSGHLGDAARAEHAIRRARWNAETEAQRRRRARREWALVRDWPVVVEAVGGAYTGMSSGRREGQGHGDAERVVVDVSEGFDADVRKNARNGVRNAHGFRLREGRHKDGSSSEDESEGGREEVVEENESEDYQNEENHDEDLESENLSEQDEIAETSDEDLQEEMYAEDVGEYESENGEDDEDGAAYGQRAQDSMNEHSRDVGKAHQEDDVDDRWDDAFMIEERGIADPYVTAGDTQERGRGGGGGSARAMMSDENCMNFSRTFGGKALRDP